MIWWFVAYSIGFVVTMMLLIVASSVADKPQTITSCIGAAAVWPISLPAMGAWYLGQKLKRLP